MSIQRLLQATSLLYILVCFTFREYYIPFLGINIEVLASILVTSFLFLNILVKRKIMAIPVGVLLYLLYWIMLISITLAAFITSGSVSIFRYILFILPILSISLIYINNESFINSTLTLIKFAVILHLIVCLTAFIDLSIGTNIYSILRIFLSNFANDPTQFITHPSLRSQGLFYNSSSLASLGLFAIGFNILLFKKPTLWLLICSSILVIISGSRVPLICLIIFLVLYKGINYKKLVFISILLFIFLSYIDLDLLIDMFGRIIRVYDDGIYNDYSLSYRMNILWPEALFIAKDYPLGTLTNPVEIIGVIDSGYLTVYIQGRWILLIALFISILILSATSLYDAIKNGNLFFFLIPLYIILGMIISNPITNPLIVMITFLYMSQFYKKSQCKY